MDTFWSHHERSRGLRPALLLATACVLALPTAPAFAQTTIGLYTDATGKTCSFSGNEPGFVTAYVVVRPVTGVTAVEFAAPVPPCLGATWVSDNVPPGVIALGNSQTGISIGLPMCSTSPVSVLAITYQQTGNTLPCCEYAIVAHPGTGQLTGSDCWYQQIPLAAVTSHFNADASCPCIGNSAPYMPTAPSPWDGETAVSVHTSLSWSGSDYDGNLAEYDLYLGTTPSPPLLAAGLVVSTFTPAAPLDSLTQHYWRVVARDSLGLETSGPTWTFTTRATNSPPSVPINVAPVDGARDVSLNAALRWFAYDVDLDPLVFDVYFGTTTPPPLVRSGVMEMTYPPGPMTFSTTYYWRIVARDPIGHESPGPVWSFETRPANYPPKVPTVVAPADGAQGQPLNTVLEWTASDIDPDTLVSDVYFGTTSPPPLVASGQSATTYAPDGLVFSTPYYWRIVVRDHHGLETSGPTWTFTTRPENFPPDVPSNPSPANGANNQSESVTLAWKGGDLDGHAVTYDVYFGTASPPPLVASNIPTASYAPGLLAFGTLYRWRIVARDEKGAETSGPQWTFTTRVNSPPAAPSNPSPGNGTSNRPVTQTLAWQCTDPDGHALTFDVYFGTETPPPLVATNIAQKTYAPGTLEFSTTYRWQIVARDAFGLERTGPTWSFTTKANTPPSPPSNPSPPNHGLSDDTPVLTWSASDVDGQPLTFDVYFGTESPLPLVASGLTDPMYEPGTVSFGRYSWRVVVFDGITSTDGPVWEFVVAPMGDANADGVVDLEDASCAFGAFLGVGPCAFFENPMADVDCSGAVTPRDARCIHKHVLDGSCEFCAGVASVEPAVVGPPIVRVSATWESDDTLFARLEVSGVPSLEAFGFLIQSNAEYVRATRHGATSNFEVFGNGPFAQFTTVGGYSLAGVPADSPVDFIELRFFAYSWYNRWAYIWNYVDDLAGAEPLDFDLGGGGGVPVLITHFDAIATDGGVEIRWELRSDEAMEGFTLYRRDGDAALPVVVTSGAVQATSQSYLDTSVEGGKTYHYELVIRSAAGGEFRSPIATVSTAALALVLGQNHPNPFNPQTVIPYELPASSRPQRVRLWILDTTGRIVRTLVDEEQGGGSYRVLWEGRDERREAVSSGVYFYVLDAGGERRTRKLVLLK